MSTSLSEVNKINLINIQPTTKYVDKNGPSTNPEYYVKKVDLDKQLSNIPTKDNVVSISKNLITNALDNYYDKDHIDGQLSCKSNTNHTHTTINNDLTINSKRLNLYSSKAAYTYFTFGKNGKDRESAVLGFGDDNMGKYAFIRVNGGKQLTIFNDKATFPSEFTVTTLNGINPSTISLNTHNHDDKYALVDHTHTTNDITDIDTLAKADHNHDEIYSKLEHTHTTSDITDIDTLAKADHNHDEIYSKLEHTHTTSDIIDVSTLAKADHNHNYNDIQNNYFKIKTETKQELVDDIYYIVYDASELLNKEQNGAHISEWVKLKIKFLDNIEMIVDKNGLTIKVGKKEFIFSESGFFDGTEKA